MAPLGSLCIRSGVCVSAREFVAPLVTRPTSRGGNFLARQAGRQTAGPLLPPNVSVFKADVSASTPPPPPGRIGETGCTATKQNRPVI